MKDYYYIVTPISNDPDIMLKRNILKEAASFNNLDTHFPLDHIGPNSSSIIYQIENALFVFVDVSYERPSCYYEIGIAQALKKPTFIIAKEQTTIHQLEGEVHFYSSTEEYKALVNQAIKENCL
jgi:nucleoside 2-deoxyribosyltransferase